MSDDSLMVEGRKYLSSKRSAELFGYSTDYVGELCRQGKVACFRKGRQWYVEEKSLFSHLEASREKIAERKHELSRHLSHQLNKKPAPNFWRGLDVSRTLVSRIGAFFVSRRLVRASVGSLLVLAIFFAQTPVARAGLEEFSLASILRISRSVTEELASSFRETAAKTGDTIAILMDKPASLFEGVSASARSAARNVVANVEGLANSATAAVAGASAGVRAVADNLAYFPADLAASVSIVATDALDIVKDAPIGVIGRLTETASRARESVGGFSDAVSAAVMNARESLDGFSQSAMSAVANTRGVVRSNLLAAIQYEDTFNLFRIEVRETFDAVIDRVADTLRGVASSTDNSPNGSESASGGGAISVPSTIAPVAPVAPSGTGKTITERIIERIVRVETPVIQNITQASPGTTVVGGVSSASLDLRLQEISNQLRAEISRMSGASSAQISTVYQTIGLATRIDQLSGTTISSPVVTGGSWATASLTGSTNISSASISALTLSTATTTADNGFNITAGCFAVNGTCVGSGSGSGTVSSGTQGQLTFYNGSGTTLTATSSIYLTQGGNIGIGTTSPNARLGVQGSIEVTGTTTTGALVATGTVTFSSGLGATSGGTGQTTFTTGDILYASGANTLSKLAVGSNGQVLKLAGGVPSWAADNTGGGGGGFFSTTTNDMIIYPTDTADILVLGANATTTTGNILETVGSVKIGGQLLVTSSTSLQNLTAVNVTSTQATTTALFSDTASSTRLFTSNFTLGRVSGFLKATAGAVATAAIDLAADISGILPTANGGTGWGAFQANAILIGNGTGAIATTTAGTNGQVLALVGGVPTWQSTTTLATITGTLGVTSGGTGLTTLTTGDTLYASGANTLAKLAAGTNGFVLAMASGIPSWVASTTLSTISGTLNLVSQVTGTLTVSNGGTGAATFGQGWIYSAGGTGALAASTSPTVNYLVSTSTTATSTFAAGIRVTALDVTGATSTFANGIQLAAGCYRLPDGTCSGTVSSGTTGQLPYYAGNGTTLTGTSQLFLSTGNLFGVGSSTPFAKLAVNPVAGDTNQFVVGSSTATSFIIDNSGRVGVGTTSPGATFSVQGNALVSGSLTLGTALSATSGGTGQSSFTTGDILYSSATNVLSKLAAGTNGFVLGLSAGVPSWVATSTLSTISGTLNVGTQVTGTLSVSNGGTGQTSFKQGWLTVLDNGTLTASTSPTVNYIVSTSTTATSTFAAGLQTTALNITGSATSTFANGIQLTAGCFRGSDGSCVGGSSLSGTTGQLAYFSGTNVAAGTSAIFLSGVQVGIGSTTPWAKLAVNPVAGDTNQFVVGSSTVTSFIIDPSGKVGIGKTAPATKLDVFEANASAQLRLSKSASLYSELTVDSTGDLTVSAAGGDIYATTENLWICDGGSCPSLTATSTAGNIFVENAVIFGNGFSFRQISVNELGLYNASSSLLMIFDQGL